MLKSKKGMTLAEVICGLAIVGLAMVFGVEIIALASTGYMRGARYAINAETAGAYVETGRQPSTVSITVTPRPVKLVFGGKTVNFGEQAIAEVMAEGDYGNVPVTFTVLSKSIESAP